MLVVKNVDNGILQKLEYGGSGEIFPGGLST